MWRRGMLHGPRPPYMSARRYRPHNTCCCQCLPADSAVSAAVGRCGPPPRSSDTLLQDSCPSHCIAYHPCCWAASGCAGTGTSTPMGSAQSWPTGYRVTLPAAPHPAGQNAHGHMSALAETSAPEGHSTPGHSYLLTPAPQAVKAKAHTLTKSEHTPITQAT
jgi:hypothetical protein